MERGGVTDGREMKTETGTGGGRDTDGRVRETQREGGKEMLEREGARETERWKN